MFSDGAEMFVMSLTIWREARSLGRNGMIAVAWVIKNRANRYKVSEYAACVKRWAFSSINSADDPQLSNWPTETDASFISAEAIVMQVSNHELADPTNGATLYFDDSERHASNFNTTTGLPKDWNPAKVQQTVRIGTITFFKEV